MNHPRYYARDSSSPMARIPTGFRKCHFPPATQHRRFPRSSNFFLSSKPSHGSCPSGALSRSRSTPSIARPFALSRPTRFTFPRYNHTPGDDIRPRYADITEMPFTPSAAYMYRRYFTETLIDSPSLRTAWKKSIYRFFLFQPFAQTKG